MKYATVSLLSAFLFACSSQPGRNPAPDSNATTAPPRDNKSLTGTYEFSSGDDRDDVVMEMTVKHEVAGDVLAFQASHPDGHGAAPDGHGKGRIGSDGVFRFTFEDSFSNRGSGTFRRTPTGYRLAIDIREVEDSRCMMFYGDFTLKKVKEK